MSSKRVYITVRMRADNAKRLRHAAKEIENSAIYHSGKNCIADIVDAGVEAELKALENTTGKDFGP